MRLLRRKSDASYELVTFGTRERPPYAILSHTWDTVGEVTYEELIAGKGKNKTGYDKIHFCADRAAEDGIDYFWVDTCCIDKRSSAELQEAINSMFEWYEKAVVCYVYLSDVTDAKSVEGEDSQFWKARWHSRGWTLQELLAPHSVNFYAHNGEIIGTRRTLCSQLCSLTRINADILNGKASISTASVAQRMSWASLRETSRPEDMAYCLMGIFSVNMSMLYGEGEKAFLRLQEAIFRNLDDHSIFAWQNTDHVQDEEGGYGLLAGHPRHFKNSWVIKSLDAGIDMSNRVVIPETTLTAEGQAIRMGANLLTLKSRPPGMFILVLRCRRSNHPHEGYLGVLISRQWVHGGGSMYVRVRPDTLTLSKHLPSSPKDIVLGKTGCFANFVYGRPRDLDPSRYELGRVEPELRDRLHWDVAPVYISRGNLASWQVITWSAFYRLFEPLNTRERKLLGRITFHRSDAKPFTIRLAVCKETAVSRFFVNEISTYIGQVSWDAELESENWSSHGDRVDCGEDHMIHMYVNDHDNATSESLHNSYLDFTFVIRVTPISPEPIIDHLTIRS